jgi:hypothetical protein
MVNDETAALLFLHGDQYLFRYRKQDGGVVYKFVSPAAVRTAFAEETIDTGWLPSHVARWGIGKRGEWLVVTFPPQKHRFSFGEDNGKMLTLESPDARAGFLGLRSALLPLGVQGFQTER